MDQIMDLSLTVAWVIDIFFEKLILQIKDLIWKTSSVHYASGVSNFM